MKHLFGSHESECVSFDALVSTLTSSRPLTTAPLPCCLPFRALLLLGDYWLWLLHSHTCLFYLYSLNLSVATLVARLLFPLACLSKSAGVFEESLTCYWCVCFKAGAPGNYAAAVTGREAVAVEPSSSKLLHPLHVSVVVGDNLFWRCRVRTSYLYNILAISLSGFVAFNLVLLIAFLLHSLPLQF